MSKKLDNFISLIDLGMAYRKAKADLFYSPRSCKQEISDFESNLHENLETILEGLTKGKELPFIETILEGLTKGKELPSIDEQTWTLVPKNIKDKKDKKDKIQETEVINSDPSFLWDTVDVGEIEIEFRLMEQLSIAFHVFAALWIHKVGHKFEEKLSESARGNRLRRGKKGDINSLSLGSTVYYLHPYCKWRDDAFYAIEQALTQKKPVVTITADVSSFYHKLDVEFMNNKLFIKQIGVELTEDEQWLHKLFIDSLHKWAENSPLNKGLPVGLVASSVIANVALFEFDSLVEQQVVPLYYGRYVDDIILVMENKANLKSANDVWDWLIKRMNEKLRWEGEKIYYEQDYLKNSEIIFSKEKNKVFLFSDNGGQIALKSIRHTINMRTSEWRALPDFPSAPEQLAASFLFAIQKNEMHVDSLRKTDKISVQRAEFALKLRDIESYSRTLSHDSWQIQRHAFLTFFIRHILVLPTFFDFFTYLPRILSLATHCQDFNHLKQILDSLDFILTQLKDCNCTINAQDINAQDINAQDTNNQKDRNINQFTKNIKTIIIESVTSAFPLRMSTKSKHEWNIYFTKEHALFEPKKILELQKQHKHYLCRDIAYRPLKQYLLPPTLFGIAKHPIAKKDIPNFYDKDKELLKSCIVEGCKSLAALTKILSGSLLPSGLLFPVRPFEINDLYILHDDPFSESGCKDINAVLLAMRGFKPDKGLPQRDKDNIYEPIKVNYERDVDKPLRIAIASWKTDNQSWVASACQNIDPDKQRLERLNRVLNQILRCEKAPQYLLFPELSIPPHWFLAIAGKLQRKNISLICGVEYLHGRRKSLHNQIWAALSHDALGFPATMIYRQDKQRPALHEEQELQQVCGKILKPQLKPWVVPPIVNHGGFYFALLVCSELTNISYRAALRGKVDALFIPEWNQDTDSFNVLVESAALDIHTYIIQCNDRQYGDSRIRAPFKNSWLRDVVRIKGGVEDYFVIGEIDIQILRAFQSGSRSPDEPFKPVPDGFQISRERKILPKKNYSND